MDAPIRYQVLIDGEVSQRLGTTFPDMRVTSTIGGHTSLHGPAADYAAIRSFMARLDLLGLTIVELRRLPD